MNNVIDIDRFYVLLSHIIFDDVRVDNKEQSRCKIQGTRLLCSCSNSGCGLQTIEAQPFSKSETKSIFGDRLLSSFYAIPRWPGDTSCKGNLTVSILCTKGNIKRAQAYRTSSPFAVSSSQPVAEVLVDATGHRGKVPPIAQVHPCLQITLWGFLLCVTWYFLFKTISWSSIAARTKHCLLDMTTVLQNWYRPFRITRLIIPRQRISPWDSSSESDADERLPRATIKLCYGAELGPPQTYH